VATGFWWKKIIEVIIKVSGKKPGLASSAATKLFCSTITTSKINSFRSLNYNFYFFFGHGQISM
jgi:hypothetical protein